MAYMSTKGHRGLADMKNSLPRSRQITDNNPENDTGSIMDMDRPVNPLSPYNHIACPIAPYGTPKSRGSNGSTE